MSIGFALQVDSTNAARTADVTGHASVVDLARWAEGAGFEAVAVADHPGSTAAPFVALAALAAVTSTIQLGTAVLNIGTWEPLALASEVATLALVSDDRVLLGVGAGHTPAEWTATGRPYPSATARVERMTEVVDATLALLRGETVMMRTEHVHLEDAHLRWLRPSAPRIPLLVGGNGAGVLRYGARAADTIELTGLGRTLPDGHLHVPDWAPSEVDRRVAIVDAGRSGRPVRLGALIQRVAVTDARRDVLGALHDQLVGLMGEDLAPTATELAETPYLLVGREDELVAQLRANRDRWGITRYTVRVDADAEPDDALASLVERLRSD